MADLVVVVPSRGRPGALREVADAFAETCTANTILVASLDSTDVRLDEYVDDRYGYRLVNPNKTMVEALNVGVSLGLAFEPKAFAVGFMGDDHRPRTKGWDQAYLDALHELRTGIVYGDDKFQGGNLPTQCAMTVDIVNQLGWMAPPSLHHLYVDRWWLELGREADCLRYLPDVVVEHMHPAHPDGPKAEWDPGYRRVNSQQMYRRDGFMFERIRRAGLPAAVHAVRALRHPPATYDVVKASRGEDPWGRR